jgi:hypothetical protein
MSGNAYHLVGGCPVAGPLGSSHVGDALMLVRLGRVNGTEMIQC